MLHEFECVCVCPSIYLSVSQSAQLVLSVHHGSPRPMAADDDFLKAVMEGALSKQADNTLYD